MLLDATTALLPPLLTALDALSYTGRHIHPPALEGLVAEMAPFRAPLEEGLARFQAASWPENLSYFRDQTVAASGHALAALDALASCLSASNPVLGAYGAMGKQTLHLCPDRPANSRNRTPPYDYVLFDPELYYSGISQSLRLKPGETLSVDHRQEHQKVVFSKPKHAFRRHLQITHEGSALVFRDPISELGTYLSFFPGENESLRYEHRRAGLLRQIREIYGGPLVQLEPDEALKTLKAVNDLLKEDPYRKKDSLGNAGSVVDLPAWITPVIVGDLHAQVDNLLKILSENGTV